ncbi:uncharacterized protein MAM_07798 [Metarhizium album ARSEF 1941]|uniref:Uncharacterized protein n=1 Tax=Metarhizium album (strain ARSEF 1941) TaxID=1081103 RepID=A0A0B2WL17_METAS|nr:uncharacterized protein MAM_07798 [Metarhizium album ARSEF 1941]KHN94369.1 hypothetical protein MAM_07798 [Metarhizium album ARSEF 1941]
MDAPTPQTWGLGLKPSISLNLPPSSIVFFPARDNGTSSDGKNQTSSCHPNPSWVGVLRAPIPVQREPAWHRIPTEYFPSKNPNLSRIIMRRIGHPQPRPYGTSFFVSGSSEIAAAKRIAAWTEPTRCKMPPSKSRKRNSFKPTEFLIEIRGGPDSWAMVTYMFMKAKVDIANGLLELDTKLLHREVGLLQTKNHGLTIPAKRRIARNDCIEPHGLWGGWKLLTYTEVLHLVRKATNRGRKRITFTEGSITDVALLFKEMGCYDPRVRVSAYGRPSLPDIADKTEPLSVLELASFQDESGKSPTKKSPLPAEPLKASPRHLNDGVVKLLPATSLQVASSPVKSLGSPSTAFIDSPSSIKVAQSPSPLARVTAHGASSSPLADIPCFSPGPTKHFCAPSFDSSCDLDRTVNLSLPPQLSLTKVSPSIAQTTPRVSKSEPSTPPFQIATPQSNGGPGLGLVESIPTSTPKLDGPSTHPISSVDPTRLKFGPSSPTFKAPTWLSSTITSRAKETTKKITRRKSEPVIRSHVRSQVARRQTISPRRYDFTSEGVFDTATTAQPAPTLLQHQAAAGDDKPTLTGWGRTPEKPASSEATLTSMTPAISWGKMTGRRSGDGVQSTPAHRRVMHMDGLHNIDVCQNPDIFGAPAAHSVSSPPAINRLAEIAVDHCDGQAKVMVSEENGRLIVRFKLPTEYAHLFPYNQGMDESRFTSTPSAMSSSPRISFEKVNELALTNGQESPQIEQVILPSSIQNEDITLIIPDFVTSPVLTVEEKQAPAITTPSPETKLSASFTPVNRSVSQVKEASQTSPASAPQELKLTEADSSTQHGNQPAQRNPCEDSPGRDYMRDFIKRTHQQRLSTTETGSPVAPPVRRAPLGIKSPNVESPQKGKRKAEAENQDSYSYSTLKTSVAPFPKKARRVSNPGPGKKQPAQKCKATAVGSENNDSTEKPPSTTNGGGTTENHHEEKEAEGTGTGTRRSTRLRGQQPVSAAKSSIPTSINLRGRHNGSHVALNHTRSEEKELSNKTRRNTLKNRGNAEYPAQVLARYQEARPHEEATEENRDPEAPAKGANGRKCVGWKTPLEAHHGKDARKSRIATMKGKNVASSGGSGIAKPTQTTTTQKKQRAAKVAATLGMSQNGTPAKSNRITRSSTRVRA